MTKIGQGFIFYLSYLYVQSSRFLNYTEFDCSIYSAIAK